MSQAEYIQPPPPLDPLLVIETAEYLISKVWDAVSAEQWDKAARLGELLTSLMKVAQINRERLEAAG